MQPLPTDLEILNNIYERYYQPYADDNRPDRSLFVQIDIAATAHDLRVDADVVFGRLYYHLDRKFRYRHDHPKPNGSAVVFFATKGEIGGKTGDFVNFPYMASVLAELRAENRRTVWNYRLSIIAIVVSVGAVFVSRL